ncbi:MAG: bifunctional 5,10-methylenetetrahydrofolate dehydrogenase/5,10-methenyltetrahydrofolate cyclohydrolase [Planctomycetota bacterium]|nr:bifunctional 5,10-methylenetetrahydrofolate dehydrogenase/5,10-methenyltetrahydrofolate cyclohydrolase [Planctomycetota bacterium]
MSAMLIDGKALAAEYRSRIAARAKAVQARGGAVRLDALLIDSGDNAALQYAENQGKTCAELGIDYRLHKLSPSSTFDDIAGRVLLLNTKDEVSAIMVHLPLPEGVDAYGVQRLIAPEKDVEGVNPANIGNIVYGRSSLAPCTALAVATMAQWVARRAWNAENLRSRRAVVVGAGDVVGKPIAVLLMRLDATVVSCNIWTNQEEGGLAGVTRSADLLVAAAGVPGLITRDMVKPGAIVIDVGVNRVPGPDGKLRTVGDTDFAGVSQVTSWISPVPGGVGPMTVAMLLRNVVEAAERTVGIDAAG